MSLLRVVSAEQMQEAEAKSAEATKAQAATDAVTDQLAGYIRGQFEMMKRHRASKSGWSERLSEAMRTFNGEYSPAKLAEIKQFGGSDIYARLVAMKARGTSSLLRDVYLGSARPWGIAPPEDPDVPPEIMMAIQQMVEAEVGQLQAAGMPFDYVAVRERTFQLVSAAREASKKRARKQSQLAEERIEEMLQRGGFYKALAEFIVDLPLFPFAVLKGPIVRIVPTVTWQNGQPTTNQAPRLFWNRISPFDVWWTPGVSDIEDAQVIERTRVTRADLNDLLDLPGYNVEAIRAVLDEYGRGGLTDNWDETDSERAEMESRENPHFNQSGLISCLEFHGNVQGRMLREWGMDDTEVPDELRDYAIQAWLIGRFVIKVQLSPSPRKRHPYFITSFEKVPGTPVGNALPDILNDIQDVCNATLRSLVNNLSISSGPQVVIHTDRLAPGEDANEFYPWKRWHMQSDPMQTQSTQQPVSFFQPVSNAQELLGIYRAFSDMADELSAIPKYLSGQNAGGAGRTASGLAMLMGNASKILQTVAANIDRDVMEPALTALVDMIMLTDTTGLLSGQEEVEVLGVNVALQKETQRARQLEFLQVTANPIDSQLMGPTGRAAVLRSISETIGLPGEKIVPTDDEIAAQMQQMQMQQQAMAEAGAQAQGGQQGASVTGDQGPRENLQQSRPRISGGSQ